MPETTEPNQTPDQGTRVTIELTILGQPDAVNYLKRTLLKDLPDDIELDDIWDTDL